MNMTPFFRRAGALILVAALLLAGCAGNTDVPAANALILRWTYSTGLTDWATASATDFNSQNFKTGNGRIIWIEAVPADAGQAVTDMIGGGELPALWTPADPSWVTVLHQQAGSVVFLENCISVAESPLVIALWEPVARALGWPGRTLGWLDVASLAADSSAWAYYSGGQWGSTLRTGHTHPGLSDSGVQTLLALVHAAESTTDAVTVTDVENPVVRASVGAFEGAVSWFAPTTRQLTTAMLDRGIGYLNAAVMYENAVVTQGQRDPRLVAVYPFEGTFVATYPTCVRANMDAETTGAAETFLAYLSDVPAQQRALANGLRPVNDAVPLGPPITPEYGVDPTQPQQVFAAPDAETVFAVQGLWQDQRRNVNLAMLLDVSGSMEGAKIEQVRLSAIEFVRQMGDDDRLTVIVFSDSPSTLVNNQVVGPNREAIIAAVNGIQAGGGTSLYDSIAFAAQTLAQTRRPDEVNAMVVLSDGQDTVSTRFTSADAAFTRVVASSGASVYTIAYGSDADQGVLRAIALATDGIAYVGDVATIGDVYAEISAAFGGSLGIGR